MGKCRLQASAEVRVAITKNSQNYSSWHICSFEDGHEDTIPNTDVLLSSYPGN